MQKDDVPNYVALSEAGERRGSEFAVNGYQGRSIEHSCLNRARAVGMAGRAQVYPAFVRGMRPEKSSTCGVHKCDAKVAEGALSKWLGESGVGLAMCRGRRWREVDANSSGA